MKNQVPSQLIKKADIFMSNNTPCSLTGTDLLTSQEVKRLGPWKKQGFFI